MVASGLRYFLCYGGAWILLAILHEAAGCQRIFHQRAGDTVELPSCLPGDDVTAAHWNYKGRKVAGDGAREADRFTGRMQLNRRNYSLTLRALTREDSGIFSFVSAVNDSQRGTVEITLQVHEPIMAKPTVTVNATWHAANHSCSLLLRCSAPAGGGPVEYKWRVGNASLSGAWCQMSVPPRDGAHEVQCTVFNAVSAESTSASVTCGNNTSFEVSLTEAPNFAVVVSAAAGAFCLLVLVAAVAVGAFRRWRRQTRWKSEEATVYADISEVAQECASAHTAETHLLTLYDKIQPDRLALQDQAP
ncbi:uncharacterized protein LOC133494937 [Syngnathoides biaculeatus]|uniref:uncharacterized protein LOC133494937 n=1 Tax=Syngnathoides biaculeatus TaxID=300417 RepID=UPI002ADE5EDB|nr:uncharacterized protein LOC133494937 [Syngnathoides biaculeatus]